MKRLRYSAEALRQLKRHGNMRKRTLKAIRDYAADQQAHANNVRPMRNRGPGVKRLRLGDFRLVFQETATEIEVIDFGPRASIYED